MKIKQSYLATIAVTVLVMSVTCYPVVGTSSVILDLPSRPVALFYRAGYLFLSLLLLLLYIPRAATRKIAPALLLLISFWLVYLGRILYNFYVEEDYRGYAHNGPVFYMQYGLGGCFFPALAIALTSGTVKWRRALYWTRWGFMLSCLSCLAYIVFEQGFSIIILYSRARLGEDSVVSPIILSQTGGGLLLLSLGEVLLLKRKSTLVFFQIVLGFCILIMGASRGPMLICAFCLLLIFWEHFKWAYNRVTFWFRSVVFAGVMAGITAFFILPNVKEITFLNRVSDTVNKGNGLDERSAQWSAAWEQFLSSPAWGDKLVERALGSYPHNVVLEVLMSTGMLGGVFFFGLLIMAGWKYLQRRSVDQEFTPVYYLFIGYFGFAMFSSALITLVQFWVLLALVVSVIPIRNFGEVIKN